MPRAPSKPQYARDVVTNISLIDTIESIDTMKKAVSSMDLERKARSNKQITLFRYQIENMEKAVASLKERVEEMEKENG